MKVGDLVRYRQGSIDRKGVIVGKRYREYMVQFLSPHRYMKNRSFCRHSCLELVSESQG